MTKALAVDGKWGRDKLLSVGLADHEIGAPVAVDIAAECIGNFEHKTEGEQTVAR